MKWENKWFTVGGGGNDLYRSEHERIFGPKVGKWTRSRLREFLEQQHPLQVSHETVAKDVMDVLSHAKSAVDVQAILHDAFLIHHGEAAGDQQIYQQLATKIWEDIGF